MVLTMPENHLTKAKSVKETWGKRCDILYFLSSEEDKNLPSIAIQIEKESKDFIWRKTRYKIKFQIYYVGWKHIGKGLKLVQVNFSDSELFPTAILINFNNSSIWQLI